MPTTLLFAPLPANFQTFLRPLGRRGPHTNKNVSKFHGLIYCRKMSESYPYPTVTKNSFVSQRFHHFTFIPYFCYRTFKTMIMNQKKMVQAFLGIRSSPPKFFNTFHSTHEKRQVSYLLTKIEFTVRYTRQITALTFFCHPYFC